MSRLPMLFAAALLALLALSPAASGQAPSPTTQTQNAVTRLVNDTRGLTDADAPADTRTALTQAADRVQRTALKNPCRAIAHVRGYRRLVPKVNADGAAPPGAPPGRASKRGTLDRDALAVDAGIKQFAKTRRCGGGAATASGATVDTRLGTSNRRTLRLRVSLPRARWEALSGGGRDFVGINMDGADSIGTPGDPGVPAFTRMFAVPRGARVSVKVSDLRGYTLDDIDLMPKQEQAVDAPLDEQPPETFADKVFKIRPSAYRKRAKVPARVAYARTFGRLRDVTVGGVQVPGAQYDPRTRKARIFTSMTLTVTFKKGGKWVPDKVRTGFEAPFERIYAQTFENARTLERSPEVRASGGTDEDAQESLPACGEEYLIVTSPALRPAADTLAAAKQNAGYIVGVHEVAPNTPAGDVRTFIRGELNNDNCTRPTYVVLLGDTSHVPSFQEAWCTDPPTCTVTSDLSYSLDGISSDAFADVMLGRITANTLPVAQTVVDKIVNYQTQLPAPPGDDFYNHATVTSNFEGLGPRDQRGFTMSAEKMRAGLRSRGHVVTRLNSALSTADIQQFKDGTAIPDELKRPATAWTDSREQVVSELNAGRFLFVHRDHGSRLGWANPSFGVNDIASLNNGTELPLVLAINCASAGFQFPGNPSINERLLQRQGGGAVAVFGDTDNSPTVQNDQLTVGWADAMFPQTIPTFGSAQPLTRIGEILNAGKTYMAAQAGPTQQLTGNVYREHLIWHLLGDPSMELRTATPQVFNESLLTAKFEHRRDAYPVGDPSFRVRVATTQPGVDGGQATLKQAGEVIGRATFAGGVALITPSKRTSSASLSVAIEADGFMTPPERTVTAPVPTLTMTCPTEVNVPGEDNAQVSGTVSPKVSGATIKFRITRPNGTVTTQTTTTAADSTYRVKLLIPTNSSLGNAKLEAFYDGELKYGANQVTCTVPVV